MWSAWVVKELRKTCKRLAPEEGKSNLCDIFYHGKFNSFNLVNALCVVNLSVMAIEAAIEII